MPLAPATIDLFLHPATALLPGDRFSGGIAVPSGHDHAAALGATAIHIYLADPEGGIDHQGVAYRLAVQSDQLTWSVVPTGDGETLEVLRSGMPTIYTQWRNLEFTDPDDRTDDAVSGPTATGTSGAANLLRYAFGLGPQDPAAPAMPRLGENPHAFRFAHDPAKPDLAWIVRASPDLSDWSETLFDSRTDPVPPADGDGLIPVPYPDDRPHLFLRLELELGE